MKGGASIGRRDLLKGGTGLLTASLFSSTSCSPSGSRELTVLHTNDMHSHIEPFPEDDPDHPGEGGMARRAELIDEVRKEGRPVLLLDAGDIFQGTPYFNEYGGTLEFRLMSMMNYDAATLGNHDFDKGCDHLASVMSEEADFPFINTNYELSDTPLGKKVEKSRIFEQGGGRVGVIGAGIELRGLVNPVLTKGVEYRDPLQELEREAERLKKEEGCGLVIALSHLGDEYEDERASDVKLARKSRWIDLILGGHTHRFFKRPKILERRDGAPAIVNQVGWGGLRLGRIDLQWSEKKGLEGAKAGIHAVREKGNAQSLG